MKKKINNKAITLIALVITIVILLILSSIVTYSGVQVVKSAQFTAFSTELKIMQTQVNSLYDKKKDNEKVLIDNMETNIGDIGRDISNSNATVQTQANKVFTALGILNQENYKYYDNATIKSLGIDGVEGDFFVNIDKRSVISFDGFEFEGTTYYTLQQLPDGLYNVQSEDINEWNQETDSFDVNWEKNEEGKYKVTVSNIVYNSANIKKWQVMYKKDEGNWNTSDNYSFYIKEAGNYKVKIANNDVQSIEKEIIVNTVSNEYQQVDFIKLDNTNPQNTYITTDISVKDISTVICKYSYDGFTGNSDPIFLSSFNSSNATDITPWICSNGVNDGSNLTINPNVEKSENINTTEFTVRYNVNSTNKLKIGGGTDNNNTPIGKYYYVKVENKNNELVFYGIPCYKKSDNIEDIEIGMYDLISDTFYKSTQTEQFTKGSNIEGKELDKSIIIEE